MPAKKDPDASMNVPCFYGAELRYRREQAGLTLEQLADGSFRGIPFLSQIERGERGMPMDLARHVDERLGTDGFFQRRCEDVAKARRAGHPLYYADVPDLEKHAETLEEWAPNVIPGLLQTEPYMRVLMRHGESSPSRELIEQRVRARLKRAELWDREQRPAYWGILRESVIRTPLMPPGQMAEQLEHIVNVIRATESVLQIVPQTTAAHPLMYGMAKIMTFPDAPPLVWTESNFDGQIADFPALVKEYRRSYDLLRAVALPPAASLALIEEAARNYRDEAQQGD
ncbi:helix-turn-helix transcriptional regulator [Streptomyces sp. DT2A-34]|uniref:helix-turn-helix domain-containing protein n=1 Tax=Streptomyces sp. DT2A-34 TaxID=3051182 RepID=UPI00265BBC36|nr:helix-turn-helix transcriptional regulator [Streptomyces sp. DT2A-34]MDO0912358.1 helix-turn-helix transcriptional regulator [Streptomyces sp. DT2A-34]